MWCVRVSIHPLLLAAPAAKIWASKAIYTYDIMCEIISSNVILNVREQGKLYIFRIASVTPSHDACSYLDIYNLDQISATCKLFFKADMETILEPILKCRDFRTHMVRLESASGRLYQDGIIRYNLAGQPALPGRLVQTGIAPDAIASIRTREGLHSMVARICRWL